jgi:hypothetical protein
MYERVGKIFLKDDRYCEKLKSKREIKNKRASTRNSIAC